MSQVTHITGSTDTTLTMSSKEIADLTGKQHSNVLRDIRRMLAGLELPELKFESGYLDAQSQTRVCFNLPRDLTETLITGYNIPLRHKVVVRLRELEEERVRPVNLGDAAALRGLLIGYTEQVIKLEQKVAEDKPKVEYHDAVKASVESLTMLQVANKYGIGRTKLFKFLKDYGVIRNDEHNPPYQRYVDSGHFEVDPKFYKDKGKFVHYTQTKVTGKGDIYIGKLLRKAGLVDSGE